MSLLCRFDILQPNLVCIFTGPCPLTLGSVVPVKVRFKSQLMRFIHLLRIIINYLKLYSRVQIIYHHHHHIVLAARISLTLSRHSSLSFIALGRSSGQQPVSSHSCWMYVRAGRPAFARPCVGIHKSTSLMSSSLLLQQCPACLVRLTWIVFVIGAGGRTVGVLWGVAARTCSGLHAAFLCNCHLVSSPAVLLASM